MRCAIRLASVLLAVGVHGQTLDELKKLWRAGDYSRVLVPMIDYRESPAGSSVSSRARSTSRCRRSTVHYYASLCVSLRARLAPLARQAAGSVHANYREYRESSILKSTETARILAFRSGPRTFLYKEDSHAH